jgi:hypothetical protein
MGIYKKTFMIWELRGVRMKYCKCDHCGKDVIPDTKIHLTGIGTAVGTIPLPEWMSNKDFCDTDCFWEWCRARDPMKQRPEPM